MKCTRLSVRQWLEKMQKPKNTKQKCRKIQNKSVEKHKIKMPKKTK